jgi:hypothetical protein
MPRTCRPCETPQGTFEATHCTKCHDTYDRKDYQFHRKFCGKEYPTARITEDWDFEQRGEVTVWFRKERR